MAKCSKADRMAQLRRDLDSAYMTRDSEMVVWIMQEIADLKRGK